MSILKGFVRDVARRVASPAEAATAAARRFAAQYGEPPGHAEYRSWLNSWPPLLDLLVGAGLSDLWLELEYELPGSGERIDALLLGADPDGVLVAVVVELKQWDDAEPRPLSSVLVGGELRPHPCRQAGGYMRYLRTWISPAEVALQVHGLVFLHNADRQVVDKLGHAVVGRQESEVALLGREDAADPGGLRRLGERLAWPRLTTPDAALVQAFENARHKPSFDLFDRLRDVLANDSDFVLVGAQQEAQLHVLRGIRTALGHGEKHVIAVRGGPGTGKTVIAVRLVADIPKQGEDVRARYLTPSGTLRRQLIRAAGDPAAKGLFLHPKDYPRRRPSREVLLVDEAHRMGTRGPEDQVAALIASTQVCVFFLDERQIIRPHEGVTVDYISKAAEAAEATFTLVDLQTQFRCGGSQYYLAWIDQLLSREARPGEWRGDDYDFDVMADPGELQAWVDDHTVNGAVARISAGFCWPWPKPRSQKTLHNDVDIVYIDRRSELSVRWTYPWNSRHAFIEPDGADVPGKEFWATDPGGHRQVGCIYTAQGLEYDYSAVIMGPDLVRRGARWEVEPVESHDPAMYQITPDKYLPLALNTYRVLMTRGTRGCRLYSTDAETQQYLEGLRRPT
ncbi:DNA/RNA helicase domain-containing protein [Actinoallomurus sp. CA-142502]|uniref:DNA/RNA helicase domain-containing protein n=1 Tax=Actinoallomurus sp. CA-142502 TaxID=3239885 RepID=UPI003D93428E